ncbi:Asp-tRNA(Asn)/Glu-tRNA(Gln) amidotransferase GatCAB subunit A, partial [Xanthomonas citri pv. citri]|nr:Asp-tRNA(Asn)/Glu-tRNA(Gln) amidotransferase GatCAB subunit A [Xanthomonas citri pv. citri]
VLDTAMLHNVIAGHDDHDSTSLSVEIPNMVDAALEGQNKDLSGVKIGLIKEFLTDEGCQPGVAESFRQAVETLQGLGAEIVE